MATQETVTSALAALSGSVAVLLAMIAAVACLWLGADYLLNALDVHLPVRQVMTGRTLNVVRVHARVAYTMALANAGRLSRA